MCDNVLYVSCVCICASIHYCIYVMYIYIYIYCICLFVCLPRPCETDWLLVEKSVLHSCLFYYSSCFLFFSSRCTWKHLKRPPHEWLTSPAYAVSCPMRVACCKHQLIFVVQVVPWFSVRSLKQNVMMLSGDSMTWKPDGTRRRWENVLLPSLVPSLICAWLHLSCTLTSRQCPIRCFSH